MKRNLFLTVCIATAFSWAMAQTVIFSDNFDSYSSGDRLVQTSTAAWTTWSNAPGSAEDAVISNAQSSSAPNSLYITGSNDIIYPFANQTSGHYVLDFDYYVPSSGNGAYFNVQHYYAPGTQWAFECYFNNNGTGYLSVGGTTYNFTYPSNAWFPVETDIDLDNNTASMTINDVLVAEWPFSYQQSNVNGINQLGSVNFYAGAPNDAAGTYYVDNFTFTEMSAAAAPSIQVTPSEDIVINDADYAIVNNYNLSVQNLGDDQLRFRIVPTYDITSPNPTSTGAVTFNYDGSEYTSINFTNGAEWEAGIGLPASALVNHIGRTINQVQVVISNTSIQVAKLRIYKMGTMITEGPGSMIYEQEFTPIDGWNYIDLTSPVVLDGGDIWISVWINQPQGGGGIGCDEAAQANYYGNWTKNGPSWYRLSESNPELTGNWNIRVVVDGTPITPWITSSAQEGTVSVNGNQNITLGFNGLNELNSHRTGTLHIFSNDFENPEIAIDVDVYFTNVGINEHDEIEVTVTPNPAVNFINVASAEISNVQIFNMMGQMIFNGNYNEDKVTISTNNIPAGIYVVRVTSNAGVSEKKVVIR